VLALVCVSACQASLAEPNAADAARVQSRLAGSKLSDLQDGRRLYLARCGTCHALPEPGSLAPDAWGAQVHDMRTEQGVRLSDEEERHITAYLVAISAR
jgi:cytochrome c5